jgi:hypothetical protein
MDTRAKLGTACAVFLLFSFVAMVVMVLRATDPPASKPATPTKPTVIWSTPTHFKGRNYADGLVTEYRTKLNVTGDCYTTTGSL